MQRTSSRRAYIVGVSFTGIVTCIIAALLVRPQRLESFFSGVIRTQIVHYFVPDFLPPMATFTLKQGNHIFSVQPYDEEVQNTRLELRDTAQESVQLHSNLPTIVVSLQFSSIPKEYHTEPCLSIEVSSTKLLTVMCTEITDTDEHLVILPNTRGETEVRLTTALEPENSATVTVYHNDIVVLSDMTTLTLQADDLHPVSVSTDRGHFIWDETDYIYEPAQSEIQNTILLVPISVSDSEGNVVTHTIAVVVLPFSPPISFQRYPEPEERYHYLLTTKQQYWWQPLYIAPADGQTITTIAGAFSTQCPMRRYSEPESLVTGVQLPVVTNSVGQSLSLIETE